jgi:hypothetical protein
MGYPSYGEGAGGGGDANVICWNTFQEGDVCVLCVDNSELVVKVCESREVMYSGGVVGRGDVT